MLGSMSKWIYDEDPTDALKFEKPLAELKAKIAESGSEVFQDMIKDLLLKNTHRSTIEMAPSKTLEAEQLKVCSTRFMLYQRIRSFYSLIWIAFCCYHLMF